MDREAKEYYEVIIQAKDMGGQLGGLSGTTTVNITLSDVNDNPPRFPQSEYLTNESTGSQARGVTCYRDERERPGSSLSLIIHDTCPTIIMQFSGNHFPSMSHSIFSLSPPLGALLDFFPNCYALSLHEIKYEGIGFCCIMVCHCIIQDFFTSPPTKTIFCTLGGDTPQLRMHTGN